MLRLAILCLAAALIAAVFGFGGVATAAAGVAKILFFLFLVLFIIAGLAHALGGRSRPPA